ncbi:MAG: DUF3784 domain-containing protein [Methanomassiliicoccaceae archaeon]|nr:DUF3784 domain-containing protein [Methanomassiliicoccaceae archaeon]
MEREKKIQWILMFSSLLFPILILMTSLVIDFYSMSLLIFVIVMFIMMPIGAAGAYMWATEKEHWTISRHNTSSESEQANRDTDAVAKNVGKLVFMISATILIGVCSNFYIPHGWVILAVTMMVAVSLCIWLVTKEAVRSGTMYLLFITIPIVLLLVVVGGFGSVTVTMDNDSLHVSAPTIDRGIDYADFVSMEMRYELSPGVRNGFGGLSVSSGNFTNDEFGTYTLAIYNDTKAYIVVNDGQKILVFNQDSVGRTADIFNELKLRTGL